MKERGKEEEEDQKYKRASDTNESEERRDGGIEGRGNGWEVGGREGRREGRRKGGRDRQTESARVHMHTRAHTHTPM